MSVVNPGRDVAIEFAFSTKKQSAYGTALLPTDLTLAHTFLGGDIVEHKVEKATNQDEFGKKMEFPTEQRNLTADVRLTRNSEATSLMLGWAFAFACGDCVTTTPEGATLARQHVIKPMNIDDPAVGKQLPVTTVMEKLGHLRQEIFRDILVSEVELSGKMGEQLKLKIPMIGSGHRVAGTQAMPAATEGSFLKMADVKFQIGASDISAKLLDFTFNYKNEVADKLGYHPSSGYLVSNDPNSPQVRGHLLVTKRSATMKFRCLMENNDFRADMESNVLKSITITAEGATIEGSQKHKMILEIPKCYFNAVATAKEGNFFAYDATVLVCWDDASSAPFKLTVVNNTAAYLA